jgi:phosphonate transport system substrate-binding protein
MLTRRSLVLGLAALPIALREQLACGQPVPGQPVGQPQMPPTAKRAWAVQVPAIRIGLLGGENDADRLARYDGYRALLEATFQVPAKMLSAADYAGVIQAFAAGQLEVAYMSPAAYASAWLESNGDVEPLLTTQEKDGSTFYVSMMYTRADSGITSLAQMKGHSLAWADPNSASGYLIPRAEFRAQHLDADTFFSRTGFAGGHEQAVIAVINHQYDAGVTWTSGIGDASEGYTRGALRSMVEKNMLDMKDLRVIWTSRPIENGPITVRKSTPATFRADMLAFHEALPSAHPDIYHAVDMGSGQGWVRVHQADYQIFVDMLQQEAAARRKRG